MKLEFFFSEGNNLKKLSQFIKEQINDIKQIKIIIGFITKSGFFSLAGKTDVDIDNFLKKLEYIVVGKFTMEAYDIYQNIYEKFPQHRNKLYVNYGIGRVNNNRITKFLPMIHCDNYWDFIFVGDNLLFDFNFLNERLKRYGLEEMDLSHCTERPFINLKYTLVLMNDGQFRGYTDILNQNATIDNTEIPGLYENEEFDKIIEYILEEAKSFTDFFSKLKDKLLKIEL